MRVAGWIGSHGGRLSAGFHAILDSLRVVRIVSRLVHFDRAGGTVEGMPILPEVVGPVIRARPMAANENSVFSDANGFRDSARPHALERSRREPRAVSIYKLPTGICEYAVVEEQQISIGQLDEIRFRYGLAAENRQ